MDEWMDLSLFRCTLMYFQRILTDPHNTKLLQRRSQFPRQVETEHQSQPQTIEKPPTTFSKGIRCDRICIFWENHTIFFDKIRHNLNGDNFRQRDERNVLRWTWEVTSSRWSVNFYTVGRTANVNIFQCTDGWVEAIAAVATAAVLLRGSELQPISSNSCETEQLRLPSTNERWAQRPTSLSRTLHTFRWSLFLFISLCCVVSILGTVSWPFRAMVSNPF